MARNDTVGDPSRLAERIAASPALFPLALDLRDDRVQFLRLTAADYAAASFLDSRVAVAGAAEEWLPWAAVRGAAAGLTPRCHFIFHISHVGSTLLSRLLGHHPGLFSLREPAILRTLADAHLALGRPECPWNSGEFTERLRVFLSLWSRTYEPRQTAVLKATSTVAELSGPLMACVPESRAVCMFVPPPTFLKALLDGAMGDITGAAAKRLFRLHRRLGAAVWRLADLSPGECVAMSWLCEMLALSETASRFPGRIQWVDFDRFLQAPEPGLDAALRHFGIDPSGGVAAGILAGPTMAQYAKAPSQKYDAGLRDRLLKQGEGRHAGEILKGLEWLNRAGAVPGVRGLFAAGGPKPQRAV